MFSGQFGRVFPVPKVLAMRGGGLHISDRRIKYFRFSVRHGRRDIGAFGEVLFPSGVVVEGEIRDPEALTAALVQVRKQCGFSFAHAALPEKKGYLFNTALPRDTQLSLPEGIAMELPKHVPLSPAESVYDCQTITTESTGAARSVIVTVLPESVALSYSEVLAAAGFLPLSFQLEPQAAQHAIFYGAAPQKGALCLIDFGSSKSIISVVQGGAVRFATSVEGTESFDEALEKLATPQQDMEKLKFDEGLTPGTETAQILLPSVSALASAIQKVRVYWQSKPEGEEHREAIDAAVLYGGNANINGLPEYLARALSMRVNLADVRIALVGDEERVPTILKNESVRFATVIGLALRSLDGTL